MSLNPRWEQMNLHPVQEAYWRSPHRFNVLPCGRRSGKTELFKRKVCRAAISSAFRWPARYFCGAPTRDQAKRIFWNDVKALIGADMIRDKSESELYVETHAGNQVWVLGLDKPERIEGSPWDGGGVDEYANTKPGAFEENIRPALSDREGWCDLFGVPEGRNHYYDRATEAAALMAELGDASQWGHYHWTSMDVLPLYGKGHEIEAARRDLDPLTFEQEYGASFVNFEGRAYYPFTQAEHCAPLAYVSELPLELCFDFNVEPGVCTVVQEQRLPGQFEKVSASGVTAARLDRPIVGTGVIAEVHIPRNSNTPAVCRKVVELFKDHKGQVRCYGDATGGARGSAKVEGSDWELVRKELAPVFRERLTMCVKPSNPAERARVNAVNTRLKNGAGEARLMVDAKRAPHTVRDLDGVALLEGGSGEIDKKSDPKLTHLSDALGYYVEYRFPVQGAGMAKLPLSGH